MPLGERNNGSLDPLPLPLVGDGVREMDLEGDRRDCRDGPGPGGESNKELRPSVIVSV